MKSLVNLKNGLVEMGQTLVKNKFINNINVMRNNNDGGFHVPTGVWGSKDYYLWDNWITDSRNIDGKIHRYSLFAPRMVNGKELHCHERHVNALIRHAYSLDDGNTWNDTGCIFTREQISHICEMLWSGSTIIHQLEDNTYQFAMFVTASKGTRMHFLQKICVSYSSDGENWSPLKVCLEYEPQHGYSLSAEDKEDPAWRDPYVWQDPNTKEWYMFFCSKKINIEGKVVPCVGVAKAINKFDKWELLPGIEVTMRHQQLEMPAIIYKYGYYYLFCCGQTTSGPEVDASYYAYVSKTLDTQDANDWKCIYCSEDDSKRNAWEHLFGKIFYGTSIFEDINGNISAAAFHASDYTLTPIIPITWNYNVNPPQPSIQYNLIHAAYVTDEEAKIQERLVSENLNNLDNVSKDVPTVDNTHIAPIFNIQMCSAIVVALSLCVFSIFF